MKTIEGDTRCFLEVRKAEMQVGIKKFSLFPAGVAMISRDLQKADYDHNRILQTHAPNKRVLEKNLETSGKYPRAD